MRSWFFLQAGVRYQSNASFTPFDAANLIDLSAPHGADWNAFALGQFANDIDFGDQNGDKLETRVTGYLTEQFELHALDVGLLSGSVGPRLALAPGAWPGLTVKPYLTGTTAWVGGDPYTTDGGVGVSLSAPLGSALTVSPWIEWQRAAYDNTDASSLVGTSDQTTAGVSASARLSETVSANAKFSYQRADAAYAWQSNGQFTEEFDLPVRFDPPSSRIAQKWTLTPFVSLTQTTFDEGNPTALDTSRRSDSKWQAGVALDAPVTAHFGLAAAVTYERNQSSIPNYSYDNWSALVGPTARF